MQPWNRITEGIVCCFIGACQSNLSDGKIMKSCKWPELLCSLSQCTKTCGFFLHSQSCWGEDENKHLPWWQVQMWCSQPAADFYSKLFIVLRMVTWTWYRLLLRMGHPQCREEASASRQCCVNSPILHCIKHKVGLRVGLLFFPFWVTCRNNRQLLTV